MLTHAEETRYDNCPICFSSVNTWRVKKVDKKNYIIDLCNSCGYAFVNPRPSMNFLMDYYSSFGHGNADGGEAHDLNSILANEETYPNSTVDARRLVGTIKSLSNNSSYNKFLDIGCGYGFFSKEAQAAGFDVISLELAQNERKIARDLIKSDPIASSFEEFECPPESLAAILMSQILEHAFDVNGWIAKAHSLLAREGVVAIALPNYGSIFRKVMQEKEPYICPPAHLNFFSANSLSRLLENQGFKVEAVQWISRLPKSAFEKRLPRLGKPLLPVLNAASTAVLQAIDAARLGMMINVYARKV